MPVIREKQQFAIQPIGVARASTAGVTLGQAISNSANQLNEIAFKRAAENAEKTGVDQAKSFDSTKLTGINPETGAPVALDNITSMGRIQAEAYERIIDRRFEESIENEMMLKSKELAMRHSNPSTYESLMSDYIGEMSKGAEGPYSEYINNTGSVWLSKTKLVLQDNAIRAAKAAQKKAEAEANARRVNLAYNIGRNNDWDALHELTGQARASGEDVATFTGDVSAMSKSQRDLAGAFAAGYAPSALADLSPAGRTNLRIALEIGVPSNMDAKSFEAYKNIRNLLGNDAVEMAKLGNSLSGEVSLLNSVPTQADIEATNLSNEFGVENQRLTLLNENNNFLNYSQSNFLGTLERYKKRFSLEGVDPSSFTKDDWNKRVSNNAEAENQILSGGILSLIDKSNPSQEQLENIKNGIKTGNLEPLFLMSNSVSEETKNALSGLLNIADPKIALSAIESFSAWQGGVEQRQVAAANTFHDTNLDRLNAAILDGQPYEDVVAEYEAGASKGAKFPEGVVILEDTQAIQTLRSVLSEVGVTEELLKEVKGLASGTDVSLESTPELNARGLRGDIEGLLQNISNVDRRKASVSSMLDVLPKDQAIAAKGLEVESFDARVNEISTPNAPRTTDGIVENRDNLIREINASSLLSADEKAKYISDINSNTGLQLAVEIMGNLDSAADRAEAVSYFQGTSDGLNLTEETRQNLDDVMSSFSSSEDRDRIISEVNNINTNIGKAEEMRAAAHAETAVLTAAETPNGVIPNSSDPKTADLLSEAYLGKLGLTAVPPDMFTNIQELSAAASDPSDPRHNEGQYLAKVLDLASRGVVSQELNTFIRAGLRGAEYGGKLVNINDLAEVMTYIGGGQDAISAQQVRSSMLTNSGFDMTEVGIIEGVMNARLLGVPSEYMPRIIEGLRDAKLTDELFETQTGKNFATVVLKATDTWFSGGKFTTDLNLQKEMISFARGLFLAGRSEKEIDSIVGNFVSESFYSDNFSISPSSLSQNNVRVGIERTFPDNAQRSAALQLYQVSEFARLGAENYPSLSPREQIEQGAILYRRENKYVMTNRSLITFGAGERTQSSIVFAPRYNDTNMSAVFTPYRKNVYGDLEMIADGTKISSNDPRISMLAAQMAKLDLSGDRPDRVIENYAINFFLNRGR